MGPALLLALSLAGPAGAEAPDAPGDEPEADAPAAAEPAEEAPRRIRLVWEAGAEPIAPSAFLDAVLLRLPPGAFAPVEAGDPQAWVVLVRQPEPGVYHLEVAPPGRRPEARRLSFDDPTDGKRRLALLTAYALEHGTFPPVEAGSGVEEAAPQLARAEGATAADRREPPPTQNPPPTPAPEVAAKPQPTERPPPTDRGPRLVVRAAAALALTARPAAGASNPPGGGGALDLGLVLADLVWLGLTGDASAHPTGDLGLVRAAGGAFAGVRPIWGSFVLGARVAATGGAVVARRGGRTVRRGFAAGTAALSLGLLLPRARGLGLFVEGAATLASRASTFETPEVTAGFGRLRGRILLGLAWQSPHLRGRRPH